MTRARRSLSGFWAGPGGGREVLAIGTPLMLSQLSFTVQTFVDRLFLTWYSTEAMAGAVSGLFCTIALIGTFTTTGEYLTTFIAQYVGAGRRERVGPAVWQGIYFSLASGLLVAALVPLAEPFFALAGHAEALRVHEVAYAEVLLKGSFWVILMATLSSFFAGRGQTAVVLLVNVVVTIVNCVLDYLWIFGRGGFAATGVTGAARATIVSQVCGAAIYLALIFRRRHRAAYGTLTGWRPDRDLLVRFIRYGLPSGLQFLMEVSAFAVFLLIIGRIGTEALGASGIAFNLNMIVFMPMVGLATGVSSLVGRHLGAGDAGAAERSVHSAFRMSLVFLLLCAAFYLFAPRLLLAPYASGADPAAFAAVGDIAVVLLRFVAAYSIFDMMTLMYAAGLKGAGDTRFPLAATAFTAVFALLLPTYVACVRLGGGVNVAWTAATAYVAVLGPLMVLRFRKGGWKAMRVIESAPEAASAIGPYH